MAGQQIGEVSRGGGWKGSPNSIAVLRRYQVRFPLQRRSRRWLKGDGFGRAERRYLGRLERLGLLPWELLALPCWRRLTDFPTKQRSPMRLALLQAWDKRDKAPLAWTSAQRRALAMVPESKRRRPAGWYLADI
jgi:hypothetical protein